MRVRRVMACLVLVPVLTATGCISLRDGDDESQLHGMHGRTRGDGESSSCNGEWRMPGRLMMGGPAQRMMPTAALGDLDEEEFLVEMVAHHEEAVASAGELERSDRVRMRALGRSIVDGQSAEMEAMRAWLDEWYDEVPEAGYHAMMRDLSELTGDRLDRVFLQDMIGHHMIAVMMANRLLVCADNLHPAVAHLARSISRDQRAEIMLMGRWLHLWFGAPAWGGSMPRWMLRP